MIKTHLEAVAVLAAASPALAQTAERRADLLRQRAAIDAELAALDAPETAAAPVPSPTTDIVVEGKALSLTTTAAGQTVTTIDDTAFRNTPATTIADIVRLSPGVAVVQGNGPRDVGVDPRIERAQQLRRAPEHGDAGAEPGGGAGGYDRLDLRGAAAHGLCGCQDAVPMTRPLPRRFPSYATVWRWHFYAGLFCIPFVVWRALTGSVYLFRPQIEALLDRPYAQVSDGRASAGAAAQAAAAVRAVPGSIFHRYQLPATPSQAVQVIVGRAEDETRVYVHPASLAILKIADEDMRPMRIVFRLHGELLIGTLSSLLVELAASWAIVMLLTGLFLWWPRGGGIAGVVYPRLGAGGRRFWRDLHAVTGFWVSGFALAFLVSGLPWATSWGAYLKTVRSVVEAQPVRQEWSTGSAGERAGRAQADAGTRAMQGAHAEHRGMTMAHPPTSYAPLDRIVARVAPLVLAGPVLIAPPTARDAPWTAKSDAANRPLRTELTVEANGDILTRRDFARRRLVDRIVGYGITAHEGALFGWVNQLLNLLTAIGLTLLAVSSVVLWWRRRPPDTLGAPLALPANAVTWGFLLVLAALAVALPLMGATMLLVLGGERLVLRRMPRARVWLGLRV